MRPAPRRWKVAEAPALPGYPALLGQILAARGWDEAGAAELLSRELCFHDPLGLKGMAAAVEVIGDAVRRKRRIAIYGDYDADGVTACALLTRGLRSGGADVLPYIPHRVAEGYGLHAAALQELGKAGVECVVTVDCGTSSVEAVSGRPAGMRLVITDHHLPQNIEMGTPVLAPADALINPKQPGCEYQFDGLAGVGVAWKLLQALEQENVLPAGVADANVALAALGTITDIMSLSGENRAIVRHGLPRMTEIPGIAALAEVASMSLPLQASDIAFGIGPRINAAGRMEDARLALELCLAEDRDDAWQKAVRLNEQNRLRQQAVATAFAAAEAQMESLPDDAPAIVLGSPDWPMGIVGLVAGRLSERYARPAFVVCLDPKEAKGSGRSIPGVHLVRALDGAAPTLLRYGGHTMAAGFSLEAANFAAFRDAVCAAVAEQIGDAPRERVITVDAQIEARDCTPPTCALLAQLEPCGQGNPQPALVMAGAEVLAVSTFGAEKQHVRLTLRQGEAVVEAIAFYKPHLPQHLPRGRRIDICFSLDLDTWQGQERVRARLRDLRPARAAVLELPGTVEELPAAAVAG